MNDMNEKKTKLLNIYADLLKARTGYSGPMLDGYVEALIKNGEQYYGANFVEDVINEKREDSIIWLMDEIAHKALNQEAQPAIQSAIPKPTNVQNEPIIVGEVKQNTEDMNLKEEWVHYLMSSNMTEKQARDYAADPNNNWNYEEWLKQRQLTATPALPPASDEFALPAASDEFALPAANDTLSTETTMEAKKQLLLAHHEDEIKKRIFGSHVLSELNPIQTSELDSGLEEIIKNGELHYGSDFVDNFAKLTSKDEIDKILRSLPVHPALEAEEDPIVNQATQPIPSETKNIPSKEPDLPEVKQAIPATARKGTRKEAPQSLFAKLKEKWKNASFKKKLLIVAIGAATGLAIAGAIAYSVMSGDNSPVQTVADGISNTDANTINDALTNGDVISTHYGNFEGAPVHDYAGAPSEIANQDYLTSSITAEPTNGANTVIDNMNFSELADYHQNNPDAMYAEYGPTADGK